ncbi:hypothetical protein [Streptomyces violascens]|uniref:hypothetical protein n=1 Tax=Streptomyces violascens TaxID=67381 RepID=UPI0016799C42|nr:hypothetical protein [Streptomyces violascens]GGU49814.1 hypothetical protein GCM10010289_82860 [Streptomyces violascens]
MDETTGAPGASPEPAPVPAPPADEPRGFLASALAPIAPAHPAADDTDDEAAGSSADYHHSDDGDEDEEGTSRGKSEGSVIRAFLLAAAERYRKGAGANIKRLEADKAKHQAHQTKTAHTISENRVGGTTTTNTNANKSDKAHKGANLRQHTGNNTSQAKSNKDAKKADTTGRDDKHHKQDANKHNRDAKTARDDKNHDTAAKSSKDSKDDKHADSRAAKTGRDDKNTTTVHDGTGGQGLAPAPKGTTAKDKDGGKSTGDKGGKDEKAPAAKDNGQKPKTSEKDPAVKDDGEKPKAGEKTEKSDKPEAAKTDKDGKDTAAQGDDKTKQGQTPTGGRPRTQSSREAGYRDGNRAARGVAHIEAYRDGARDGYADGREQAQQERKQLDQARDERKADRSPQNPQEGSSPVSGHSSADYHQPAAAPGSGQATSDVTPVQVNSVDKEGVQLGAGAARASMTRGEVRTLKAFERRLKARAADMVKVAEVLKALVAYENQQARSAYTLMEKTKGVRGGAKLLPTLRRLAEAAKVQAAAAEESRKRAVRAAESCRVVLANVEKRDGLIYKAVVDSPETVPAEKAFYEETA